MRICIDAGHCRENRGGVCFNEGENNFYFSQALKEELLKYENVAVFLTRTHIDDNPTLSERAKMGDGCDLFLSIHSNAHDGTVRGTEIWDSVETPNTEFANLLCARISDYFGHKNRGVKYREGQPGWNYYGVLRFNKAKSSMIVENGFHDNIEDCTIFKNGHKELAKIYAETIAEYYGLRLKNTNNKQEIPAWKLEGLRYCAENLGVEFDTWVNRLDESVPVWTLFEMIKRVDKK